MEKVYFSKMRRLGKESRKENLKKRKQTKQLKRRVVVKEAEGKEKRYAE